MYMTFADANFPCMNSELKYMISERDKAKTLANNTHDNNNNRIIEIVLSLYRVIAEYIQYYFLSFYGSHHTPTSFKPK